MVIFMLVGFVSYLAVHYIFYNRLLLPQDNEVYREIYFYFKSRGNNIYFERAVYIFCLISSIVLVPRIKAYRNLAKSVYPIAVFMFIVTTLLLMYGFFKEHYLYNTFVYPAIFILNIPFVSIVFSKRGVLKEEKGIFGISREKSKFLFKLSTNKGYIHIHKPNYHTWVEGMTGSGKSANVFIPVIEQTMKLGLPAFIYDYEGNPSEPEAPVLTNHAYYYYKKYNVKSKGIDFKFLNFNDFSRSVRINIFSNKYLKNFMDVEELTINLMNDLNKMGSGEKRGSGSSDFWEKFGATYVTGIACKLFKDHPDKCTFPHIISIANSKLDDVMAWAGEDDLIRGKMKSLFTAYDNKAGSTLASAEISSDIPINMLKNEIIFWLFSKDEFDLRITNPESPSVFAIGNDKNHENIFSPVISLVCSILMKYINTAGNYNSVFVVDEFPTLKLNNIDRFLTTVRKHNCATLLGVQNFEQAIVKYGKNEASIIRGNCMNQFFGTTTNPDTADYISKSFGTLKKLNLSYNLNQDNVSVSESLKDEKIFQFRDLMQQPIGHFTGRIADGKPQFFSTQFKYIEYNSSEIDQFSLKYDVNKEINNRIIDEIVLDNFNSINEECKEIILN